ncbi:MAG: SCO family protein [Gammaproteobacteria bacterium]|nr:SCO family protein [Gammaproteobacteria bacterium]
MTEKKKQHAIPIVIVLGITLLVVAIILFWSTSLNNNAGTKELPDIGGDFTLQSAEGAVSLSDYRGKVVVLYFGYAFCPDVCPTSLGLLSLALAKLKPEELDKIQTFFISVDPERDTVEKLKTYANAFHPNIIGITGTADEIADIAERYGVMYMKVELPGSAMGYAVDHSSRYYVIGSDGKLQKFIEHGTSPDDIVESLRSIM